MYVMADTWINLSTSDYHLFLADRSVLATELDSFFPQSLSPSGWKGPQEVLAPVSC